MPTDREIKDIQLNFPLLSAFPGGQGNTPGQGQTLPHSLRIMTTYNKDGSVRSSQHLAWTLTASDFTPELLADINASLADLDLVVSVKPATAPGTAV